MSDGRAIPFIRLVSQLITYVTALSLPQMRRRLEVLARSGHIHLVQLWPLAKLRKSPPTPTQNVSQLRA